jgi:hypothetical protein
LGILDRTSSLKDHIEAKAWKDCDVLVPPDDVGRDKTELFVAHLVPGAQQRNALHAVLCGADHNIRLLLKKLRLLLPSSFRQSAATER